MNIKIIAVVIICVISVSTAEAFEFRGHNYECGAHFNDVGPIPELDNETQNDSTNAKNIKIASRPENIIAIHGFYIGMPLTEAVEILNEKFKAIFADTDMQITMTDADYELFRKKSSIKPIEINIGRVKNYSGYVTNYYLKFDQCFIFGKTIFNGTESSFIADEHGKLIEMYLSNSEVNRMFNVADMKADSFVQAFVNAYKISQMKSVWEGTSMKWEYTSPEGFKISIKDDKSIKIEKAIKAKERNFS